MMAGTDLWERALRKFQSAQYPSSTRKLASFARLPPMRAAQLTGVTSG